MVLDALIKIKNEIDPTLTFRRSCREGICGSCAMNMDGRTRSPAPRRSRTCKGEITISPLPHMEVIKDLVPDFTHFYAQYASIQPWLQTEDADAASGMDAVARKSAPSSTASTSASCAPAARPRARAIGGIRTAFCGPAILLQAYRWLADSRDEMTGERLDELEDPFRLYRCHTIMNCAQRLPQGPEPGQGDRRDQSNAGEARGSSIRPIRQIAVIVLVAAHLAACDSARSARQYPGPRS